MFQENLAGTLAQTIPAVNYTREEEGGRVGCRGSSEGIGAEGLEAGRASRGVMLAAPARPTIKHGVQHLDA